MIPTELFIAICKYLHPADLLNLSRTCHNYRDILYYLENETTKEIWKFSRSKFMPFLPNPKKINEILYIRCVLEKKCQFCMKRTGHVKTYWAYGVYSCRNCIKSASRTRGYFANHNILLNCHLK
ncbi:hypothetical protein GLOIN_2v1630152 [Rhizophagus irregularis DAOM 181602=DAOM 197198]|uniref:F-box domain-containing protein n=1 Tax=Rhizophagus irregularis (strain DAOM 181602 / DAOM 197198 / MUCL 43194) TaxID=747089 RepID=A0A2P4PUV4_RHIID|nr:hypothetical protein GLOIN_2v1630152 [Rhizophagus irregularis DAOM 181602=DAOM 197198]POG69154.1 hypothetical protein GLOIN_2v1630152 [Rhizophagus irregularis DAOM 181602=DAOM 197198]|eukprot:XP_025176020.1 hypothetical protein GLOIN_2v1630152 [Rhizophagus irregularis DAOM 181602=DAOM 197198]